MWNWHWTSTGVGWFAHCKAYTRYQVVYWLTNMPESKFNMVAEATNKWVHVMFVARYSGIVFVCSYFWTNAVCLYARREGTMSHPAEIEQAIKDIVLWQIKKADKSIKVGLHWHSLYLLANRHALTGSFEFNAQRIPPAEEEEVQPLQKMWRRVPMSLISLLSKHNGGLYFYEHKLLSAHEIVKTAEAQAKASEVAKCCTFHRSFW